MSQEELLKRAFQLTRRHPWLWLLALLAGETAGGGSYSSSGGTGFSGGQSTTDLGPATHQVTAAATWLIANLSLVAAVVVALLVLGMIVSCLATGALYSAQVALDAGGPFGPGQAWASAREPFWRLLGFRFLTALALLAPYVLLAAFTLLMFLAGGPTGLGAAAFIDISVLFFLGIGAFLAWPLLTLASRGVVLDGLGPVAALRTTFRMVSRRAGRVAVTAGIAIGLGIAIGVVFSVVDTIVALPFTSAIAAAATSFDLARIWNAALPLVLVLVPVSMLLGSVAGSFYSAYWTLSFRHLDPAAAPFGNS